MSYIGRSLGDGERVIAFGHFHWLYSFVSWLALILAAALAVALVNAAPDLDHRARLAGVAIIMGIGLIVFLKRMIAKWTTEIGVTSHRFVKKTGWISLATEEIALPNIEGVKVQQGFWGRILGFGRLRIEGTGVDAVMLPTISDPVGFRRAIETAKGAQ